MNWDKIYYTNCLDDKEGLYSIEDNSIEIGFTDPPYNKNYKGKNKNLIGNIKEKIYKDKKESVDYLEWCREWFHELKRICYGSILIHCGNPNLNMWISDIENPIGILWHYKEDVQSQDSVAHLMKLTPILVYRNLKKRFKINPIKIKNRLDKRRGTLIHPCPLNSLLLIEILKRQEPKSVIDPFMGSGTTAFCCRQLDIKYIGYEINEQYKEDYIKEKQQTNILNFQS